MAQQTPGQARVIDPILTNIVRGYKQPGLVGRTLFPLVPVGAYGGQVIEFGKEAFRTYNTRRAPGSATRRIQFGYAGKPFAIVPNALEATVPRELMRDANMVPGIDLAQRAIGTVMNVMWLGHEIDCATAARATANYDSAHKVALSGTSMWTDPAGTPIADIMTGREAIRAAVGMYPNAGVISARAFKALKTNPSITDRVKYGGTSGVPANVTLAAISELFEIPNLSIGMAMSASGQTDVLGDVWGGDVVLAYANVGGSPNAEEPGYGYTYVIEGNPLVEQPYWDNNAKSWAYGVSFDYTAVPSGFAAGYLIGNASA
jgi:hypothetical protein